MSKLKWEYFEADEGESEFWNAHIPELDLHIEVYPAPMNGYRYCLSNGSPRPLFASICRETSLEDTQETAVIRTADYLEALSKRLRNKK